MAIPFPTISSSIKVPLFYADVVPAPSAYSANLRVILVGERAPGSGFDSEYGTPYILSDSNVTTLFGRGTPLAHMYYKTRLNAPFAEIWGIAEPVAQGSTRAAASIKVAHPGSAIRQGTAVMWMGGKMIAIPIRKTDTQSAIAARLASTINYSGGLDGHYLTAWVDPNDNTNVLMLAKWLGATGNSIVVSGDIIGHNTLAGLTFQITQPHDGVGGGSMVSTLAGLGDMEFDVIVMPVAAGYDGVDDFMDGISGRWSPIQQLYGHVFAARAGQFADQVTFGLSRNGPHISTLAISGTYQPAWEWASALGGQAAAHWANPPEISRPLQGLELKGMMAPYNIDSRWNIVERQNLIDSGMSVFKVDGADSTVRIDRIVTHHRVNEFGDPDLGWMDAVTMFQAQYFVRRVRQAITETFPRAALSDRDTGIPGFASPGQIRDLIIHEYMGMERAGLVENTDLFAKSLIVERDETTPTRVNISIIPDFVNQLRIVAALVQTSLQLRSADIAFAA